jgi:hypothetical protein
MGNVTAITASIAHDRFMFRPRRSKVTVFPI